MTSYIISALDPNFSTPIKVLPFNPYVNDSFVLKKRPAQHLDGSNEH
jgi:hypothetical protein